MPELSGVDDGELEWMCAAWPVERLGDRAFDDELAVDVPTLVVQGGINPTGHVEWGRQLAGRTLTHGTVVTFPTLGHNAMTRDQPPCLDEIRQSFTAGPKSRSTPRTARRRAPPSRSSTAERGASTPRSAGQPDCVWPAAAERALADLIA